MPTFERGDIVRVPFPYVDRNARYHRPAAVLATDIGLNGMLIWVAMVTAAENRRWPGDVVIEDHLAVGLPIPSIVRTSKVATIETRRAEYRGALSSVDFAGVEAAIASHLQLPAKPGGFHE
jgi:mRNA interferase MazF